MEDSGGAPVRALAVVLFVATAPLAAWALAAALRGDRLPPIPAEHTPRVVDDPGAYWSEGDPVGNPATVHISIFGDYACEYCRAAWSDLLELQKQYPELQVVWRHHPLGMASASLAVAAECARRQGRFEAMHAHLLSEVQLFRSTDAWRATAVALGVPDTAAFMECVLYASPDSLIASDVDKAGKLGVRMTPTLLVDSLLFEGSPGHEYLAAYIRQTTRRAAENGN